MVRAEGKEFFFFNHHLSNLGAYRSDLHRNSLYFYCWEIGTLQSFPNPFRHFPEAEEVHPPLTVTLLSSDQLSMSLFPLFRALHSSFQPISALTFFPHPTSFLSLTNLSLLSAHKPPFSPPTDLLLFFLPTNLLLLSRPPTLLFFLPDRPSRTFSSTTPPLPFPTKHFYILCPANPPLVKPTRLTALLSSPTDLPLLYSPTFFHSLAHRPSSSPFPTDLSSSLPNQTASSQTNQTHRTSDQNPALEVGGKQRPISEADHLPPFYSIYFFLPLGELSLRPCESHCLCGRSSLLAGQKTTIKMSLRPVSLAAFFPAEEETQGGSQTSGAEKGMCSGLLCEVAMRVAL